MPDTFRQLTVSPAEPAQLSLVVEILDEAAGWLIQRGIEQWPDRFLPGWVAGSVSAGDTFLAWRDGVALGTVTLERSDQLWTDGAGAGYVHRLATRRGTTGLGAELLGWAARTTRRRGHTRLRLDCVAHNRRLCAYYEAAGFAARGTVTVGGFPGQRIAGAATALETRYELMLSADEPVR